MKSPLRVYAYVIGVMGILTCLFGTAVGILSVNTSGTAISIISVNYGLVSVLVMIVVLEISRRLEKLEDARRNQESEKEQEE